MFSLNVLGGASLEGDAGPVTGRAAHKRRVALLAILAAARGRPVARERIVGLLWSEHPTDAARRLLSESLYVVRKELEEEVFISTGDEVALNGAVVRSDLGEFQDALDGGFVEAALRLYRGPLLDGFYVADAPEFERWAEEERDRLARAFARGVESVADEAEGAGRLLDAVEWWRRLAGHDRFSSRIAARLVQALDAAGERAAALRYAVTHAALLREELGVEPGPELARIVERLRAEPAHVMPTFPLPAVAAPPEHGGTGTTAPAAPSESVIEASPPGREVPSLPAPAGPARAPSPRPAAVRWNRAAYRAGTVGMILGLLIAAATGGGNVAGGPPDVPGLDPRRIAVLPFEADGGDAQMEALAAGLTGALIDRLSDVQSLRVISRSGVLPYGDRAVHLDSVVRDLEVGTLVTGRLQRSGGSYRVAVQLVDGNSGEQLGSERVQREEAELFALEDAVADQVERFLRRRLGDHVRLREQRAATRSSTAYTLVFRAQRLRSEAGAVSLRNDSLDIEAADALLATADSLLARAEEEDARWAQPRIERAQVWLGRSVLTSGHARGEALRRSIGHAERALALPGDSTAALEARGTAYWRLATAFSGPRDTLLTRSERDLRAATARDPARASAWSTLSQMLRFKGALAESRQAAQRALEEDAYLVDADNTLDRLFRVSVMLADYREAARWCDRGREAFPRDWRFVECRLTLMREDPNARPDPELAWSLVARLEEIDPADKARRGGNPFSPIFRRMVAASISARAGDTARARAENARARQETAANRELSLDLDYEEAYLRLTLGEREEAIRLLRRYLAARPNQREFLLRDPLFVGIIEEI
ncbi:MAG: hypothetical protein AVDCRST_MAG68-5255 [uncultured Gemmatimonadetes bacterium]|uniref:Bacterial transcriptional activator domain-containing protein n=1 Tax=uncultured Gemmatimonadota bacterium TaxID=203437 RepID=A0A6J4MWS9_9BACT|nr:MAG: hypothetical protein AVDCRST_MAG68-5255 [uncultured Gemmatimonadota bacterium]